MRKIPLWRTLCGRHLVRAEPLGAADYDFAKTVYCRFKCLVQNIAETIKVNPFLKCIYEVFYHGRSL